MNKQKTNWIKAYFIDVLPCMSLAIYVLAFLYNIAFYSVFNIDIISYISLSELLFSIIEPLIIFSFLSFFFAWFIFVLFTAIRQKVTLLIEHRASEAPKNENRIITQIKLIISKPLFLINRLVLVVLKKFFILKKGKWDVFYEVRETLRDISVSIIFFGISYYLFENQDILEEVDYGLYKASMGLYIPLLYLYTISLVIIFIPKWSDSIYNYFTSLKTERRIIFFILYYIYALIVFYTCGLESGNYYKEHNRVAFELKVSDGSIYSDSLYTYIGQTNESFFLREKRTENNIILNSKSIVYTKLKNNQGSSTIIPSFLNNMNKRQTKQ